MSDTITLSEENGVECPLGHRECLICGQQNPLGLHLNFIANPKGQVQARFQCNQYLQSYDGILHGGAIAAMLDAAMTNCLFHHSVEAVTASLEVRYLRPIPSNSDILITGEFNSTSGGLYEMSAFISSKAKVMAKATARFLDKEIATKLNQDSL